MKGTEEVDLRRFPVEVSVVSVSTTLRLASFGKVDHFRVFVVITVQEGVNSNDFDSFMVRISL